VPEELAEDEETGDDQQRVVRSIVADMWGAGQIAARFTLTQQAASQHIGVLKQAGLLTERREGTRRLYATSRLSRCASCSPSFGPTPSAA